MALEWRAAAANDAPAIGALSRAVVQAPPERDEIFAERIALCPDGCLVLADGGDLAGYVVSHPWRRFSAPALDRFVHALPEDADAWFVHDLALAPQARGIGAAATALDMLARVARPRGFAVLSLVAVGDAGAYWARRGFAGQARPELATKLAGYGPGAAYMERGLDRAVSAAR
jgi:GNAT superfamily N-acetyltransferase